MLCQLAKFATPLHTTIHRVPFQWSTTKEAAYRSLKVMLSHALVVQPLDWSQPFHVFVDASDVAIGSALMQRTPPNQYRSVYYASRRISIAENNYSTTEREALSMYLVNKQALDGRLAQWMLLLQEFEFDIHHRLGIQHTVAGYLSRLESTEPVKTTYDDLLDANLFGMTTTTQEAATEDKWIYAMTQFFNTRLPPNHLTLDAKKRLVV